MLTFKEKSIKLAKSFWTGLSFFSSYFIHIMMVVLVVSFIGCLLLGLYAKALFILFIAVLAAAILHNEDDEDQQK